MRRDLQGLFVAGAVILLAQSLLHALAPAPHVLRPPLSPRAAAARQPSQPSQATDSPAVPPPPALSGTPAPECRPRAQPDPRSAAVPLTVVTAASEMFFGRLENLVGSVHLWEPALEVAVYDLGLTAEQADLARSWCRVSVVGFADRLPGASGLRTFAWKALVLQDAAQRFGKVFYMDSGIELRRPIDFVKRRIDTDGYFCVGMGDSLTWGGRPAQAAFFNESMATFLGKPMIAGGIHGVARWSSAYEGLVVPAARCALDSQCITPPAVEGETRSFGKDQPLFSMLAYLSTAVQCVIDPAFTRFRDRGLPPPEVAGRQVLLIRRGAKPKPFAKYIVSTKSDKCSGTPRNQELWSQLSGSTAYAPDKPCSCVRKLSAASQDRVKNYARTLHVVTVAGSKDFDYLSNLHVSMAKWEPSMSLVVYDSGMDEQQLDMLYRDGMFSVTTAHDMSMFVNGTSVAGIPKPFLEFRPLCAASVVGIVSKEMYDRVVAPLGHRLLRL
eukprot:m51a1_g848 hypothetical protein (498) ;mRNA; r:782885-784778